MSPCHIRIRKTKGREIWRKLAKDQGNEIDIGGMRKQEVARVIIGASPHT